MVKFSEIVEFLDGIAPRELAESYDNVGVLVGSDKNEIAKALVTLDTDSKVADEAKKEGADLIISHHPLIFNPVKTITDSCETGRTIRRLVKEDIALFAMHTNFDSAKGGLCDFLAEKIFDVGEIKCLDPEKTDGIGRVVKLKKEITLSELCENIKKILGLAYLRVVGDDSRVIKTAAVVAGGGGSMSDIARDAGADVYISGDFKYQHGRDASSSGLSLIEITHYDAEIIFCEYIEKLLKDKFGDKLEIIKSKENTNVWRTV